MKPKTPIQKLIIIVGPTASGKSELAVQLAQKINGEIISADSRQVYKDIDIGTGKILGQWKNDKFIYKNIPHHCIDMIPVKKSYTVADFKKCAEHAIDDIKNRDKIPMLVGGTGFWVDTVAYDLKLPAVAPNQKLRQDLERRSLTALFTTLQKLDPSRAHTIDQNNPRRLIRAIEIATAIGTVPKIKKHARFNILWLGIKHTPEKLSTNIEIRAKKMLRKGLIGETKNLLAKGVNKKRIQEVGFEYSTTLDYITGKIDRKALLEQNISKTRAYAKRQMTWWRQNTDIQWISGKKQAEQLVRKFLQQ